MLRVSVANLQHTRLPIREIKYIAKRVLEEEGVRDGEVSIVLGDDGLIMELNHRYRGVNEVTDVLAFPFGERGCLGEVIISVDAAKRQAKVYRHSLEKEIEILLVHGVLHLIGYEDSEMDGMEMEILERIR